MNHVSTFEAGPMEEWSRWSFTHAVGTAKGKLLLGESLGLAGMEVSLNSIPPGGAIPFAHRHRKNEELYVFLRGRGQLRVDEQLLAVQPGSCVRIAPAGSRALRNIGDEPLIFFVVQASADGQVRGIEDGELSERQVHWPAL